MDGKTADQIGDEILDAGGVVVEDDPIAIEKPPVSNRAALGLKEEPDLDDTKNKTGDNAADDDKTGSTGTGDDNEPLLAGKYPDTVEGMLAMEKEAVTSIQHQSERDKAEAALLNQGYKKDDAGNWVAPSGSDVGKARSSALPKFDPHQLAQKLTGSIGEGDDDSVTPKIEIPDDFDASDSNQLIGMIGKVVGGVMKTERGINQRVSNVESQLIEIQQMFPGITVAEIEETVEYLQNGGLSLAGAHAIRTGGVSTDTGPTSRVETVEEKKESARAAARLEEFRQARDKRRPKPGTTLPGTGTGAEVDDRSESDKTGDDIVKASVHHGRRRI